MMINELEQLNNNLAIERITINSLEKLDNNYIRIKGEGYYNVEIDVITNGVFTFDFSLFNRVKKIVTVNNQDYLIAENNYGYTFLISLKDGQKIIKKAKQIDYIGDGLFGVCTKDIFNTDKVFDLATNDYVLFPDNMIYRDYDKGLLILREENKKSYDKHKEMVIDRNSNTIIPMVNGGIRIIDKNKFIANNMIIDFNQKVIIKDADLVMPLATDKIILLKNRKLFVLNNELEVIKTYLIGETKKPWYIVVNGEECITMTFKKKVRSKKYEPRIEKDITVIVNTKNDTVSKIDFIPRMSRYDVFIINGKNSKKGLMNKKSEIILNTEWDSIKPLQDTSNKYFYISKDEEYFIFNSETKVIVKVSYDEMEEFRDGLALGYNSMQRNYQLIDEELNPIFNLNHIGHKKFYYKNGILCYHSGNYLRGYDAYTIINQLGEILMPSRQCRVKMNKFGLLEIEDCKTSKKVLFDMNSRQFIQLEMNVPMLKTENGMQLDFSKLPIEQIISNKQSSKLLQEDSSNVKKLLLKPKRNETI